jgi:excisionase family DNA binding protein
MKLLTASDVAHILTVSKSTVYNLMESKKLPHISFGGNKRIRQEDLERFIE